MQFHAGARTWRIARRIVAALPVRARLFPACEFSVSAAYASDSFVHAVVRRQNRRAIYDAIWEDAARDLGATYRSDSTDDEIVWNARRTSVRAPGTLIDTQEALTLALDKPRCRDRLVRAGLPVPDQLEFSWRDPGPAVAFLTDAGGSCVVKPAGGGGGDGATTGVQTKDDLRLATYWAARFSNRLVIERQVSGAMYRVLMLDGEALAVVRRDPPTVVGDGLASVGALVVRENRVRRRRRGQNGLSMLKLDPDLMFSVRSGGVTLRSILPAGLRLGVKTSTSEGGANDAETVEVGTAGALISAAAAAARAVGLRLAGVDVITPDLSRDLAGANGAIIEVNGTPGLHYHYLVSDSSTAVRVAVPVLQRLFERS